MLIKMQIFVDDNIPTEEDVREALAYAKENNCYVKILYMAFGSTYELTISPVETFEEIWNNRRKVYPV